MKPNPSLLRCLPACCVLLLPCSALADGADDFDDNTKDPLKWGPDDFEGNGVLVESGGRLGYQCDPGTIEDDAEWPWNATRFPYDADWEIQVDCYNTTAPVGPLQVNSMGITLESPLAANTFLYHEFYNSAIGGPSRTGFNADMTVAGANAGGGDSGGPEIDAGAIRLEWTAATQLLTTYYDINPLDDYQWVELGSFGLGGAGGSLGNANWGMASTDRFFVTLYGFSTLMTVAPGEMTLDNFLESGGVAGGGARPEPVGSFPFLFSLLRPGLTRIASVTGNYTGISPIDRESEYDIDVAQDESGKVMVMGTAEGIANPDGSPEVSGSVGSIRTVNGEPVAQLKGSFKGIRDGETITASGSLTGPVAIDDSGATPVIGGTGSYQSKVAGVPFSGRNVPVQVDAPAEAEANLKQEWSFQLDLVAKTVGGKNRVAASGILVRPDGDTIVFPEKLVRYSEKTGYKLTFKKGTNTTADPDVPDAKTTILLTGLKFVKNGDAWEPVAGTITYQFLGQKGVEDLMDFVAP